MSTYQIRQCAHITCRLRFPVNAGSPLGEKCPFCGGKTEWVDAPFQSKGVVQTDAPTTNTQLEVFVDNVRSLRNVGSLFRTADGVGIHHMHLGGITPTPQHPRMKKTALGAEKHVPWTHYCNGLEAVSQLRDRGLELWALEGGAHSQSLFGVPAPKQTFDSPLLLLIGHEVSGLDPRILAICHRIVHVPMFGYKESLNVSVAFGIAAYYLRFSPKT